MVRQNSGGYTLIEVACAFAVLSVLATTVFLGEGSSFRATAESFCEMSAGQIAAGRIEEVTAADAPPVPGEQRFAVDEEVLAQLPNARAMQDVRELEPGLFEIAVEVSWTSPGGRQQRVRLTSLIARKEGS